MAENQFSSAVPARKHAFLEAFGIEPDVGVIDISGGADTFEIRATNGLTYEYQARDLTLQQREAIVAYLNRDSEQS